METVDIKIKKLYPDACIPSKKYDSDAAFDLYAYCPDDTYHTWESGCTKSAIGVKILPHTTYICHTGISMAIPDGYWGAIYARSGIATKQGIRPANAVGVIDPSYRGEIIVALHNDSDELQIIPHGSRIAQFMLHKIEPTVFIECDELDDTERGTGGFGSTGK